ncbi:hypothetical protein [Paenibacillus sp. MER TA 81-3]|uniref:hypothetical protein n=1 Tax=Paenibacillus sp. MER TA 81-3 TaxID=2939573 RepID=UPI00203D2CEC|nr:hypothetical protein [Paenibacillus sp. MER TA 81-3]
MNYSKVLPINESPLVGFLRWPYTLSITATEEKTIQWFYSNFIQVFVNKHYYENKSEFNFNFFRGRQYEFYNNPFLITTRLGNDILRNITNDIVDFYIECINLGYYVVAFIDEYYIHNKPTFKKNHLPHHLLIFGYNLHEKVFYTYGFNNEMQFVTSLIPFDEIAVAYNSIEKLLSNGELKDNPDNSNFLLKFNENHNYVFDKNAVSKQIYEYLNSKSNVGYLNYNNDNNVFGLETYNYLKQYYERILDGTDVHKGGFLRSLHVLWEHKKLMLERINYLAKNNIITTDNNELYNKFKGIEEEVLNMRNSAIKYNITNDVSYIINIIETFETIKLREEAELKRLLDALN